MAIEVEGQRWRALELPRVLTNHQHRVTADTRHKIDGACVEAGNLKCRRCRRKLSTARRLRVHASQHHAHIFARVENNPTNGSTPCATSALGISHRQNILLPHGPLSPFFVPFFLISLCCIRKCIF